MSTIAVVSVNKKNVAAFQDMERAVKWCKSQISKEVKDTVEKDLHSEVKIANRKLGNGTTYQAKYKNHEVSTKYFVEEVDFK